MNEDICLDFLAIDSVHTDIDHLFAFTVSGLLFELHYFHFYMQALDIV